MNENSIPDDAEREFSKSLLAGASILGLIVTDKIHELLRAHFRILCRWSKRLNLTTVSKPRDMAERLYLDSAIITPYLSGAGSLLDVGTGAGFPGLVLRVWNPELHVTLTEARRRKVSFLKQAARQMEIEKNLAIRWERVGWRDTGEGAELARRYDEVVSRATFPPAEWLNCGAELVAPGGRLWLYAGQPHGDGDCGQVGDERWLAEHTPRGFSLAEVVRYQLPFAGLERVVVSFRKALDA